MAATTPTIDIPAPLPAPDWSAEDAEELYRMAVWGDSFFSVSADGHVVLQPLEDSDLRIDIHDIVTELKRRNVAAPLLIRFQDILQARVVRLNQAFREAVAESEYSNRYQGVYPIKVNQLHEVVEEVLEAGKPFSLGLECGSKAELVAALAHLQDDDTLLICNGYKDAVMMRLMLAAQQLGKNVIPVMEKYSEFVQLLKLADELNMTPRFGVRLRLRTAGAGKWADSGGDQSKFGISMPELVDLLQHLESRNMKQALVLLHFHLGSQIVDVQILKHALKELTQVYAQLYRREFAVNYLDVGGGLGVNYGVDYSTDEDSGSINYTLQEYANAVVYAVMETCDDQQVPHPTLVSESGRAITAHHSVLIVEALGSYGKDEIAADFQPNENDEAVVQRLFETLQDVRDTREIDDDDSQELLSQLLEAYHDVIEQRYNADMLFSLGYLELEQKALAERLYWTVCRQIRRRLPDPNEIAIPPELAALDGALVDQYLCDFSVFQSILDHWAIGQGFPIMPIHRLDEEPLRRATLVDLTCDSDGKVSHYVTAGEDARFLNVHELDPGESYYLGFFLMGAYQDIMGDAHNLFGRVPEVHVYADAEEPGGYYIEKIINGATVQDMLALVQYFPNDLQRRMNSLIRQKVDSGVIRPKAGVDLLNQYMQAFSESTYCNPFEV